MNVIIVTLKYIRKKIKENITRETFAIGLGKA